MESLGLGNNQPWLTIIQQSVFGYGQLWSDTILKTLHDVVAIRLGLSLVMSVTYSLPPPKKICVF
jgi:hypothetical protein